MSRNILFSRSSTILSSLIYSFPITGRSDSTARFSFKTRFYPARSNKGRQSMLEVIVWL